MDTSDFKAMFAAEARDYLQSLNEDLLLLEENPSSRSTLDEMFRAAHSLKGMAGTMGYEELAHFTHEMESVLDLLRTGELKARQDVIDTLFQSVDTLEALMEQTINEEPISSFEEVSSRLRSLLTNSGTVEAQPIDELNLELNEFDKEAIRQGQDLGYQAYEVLVTLRPNTLLKSVRVYTVFQAIEGVGTIIKCNPPAQDLEEERFDSEFGLVLLTNKPAESIQQLIESISEIDRVQVSSTTTAAVHTKPDVIDEPAEEDSSVGETAASAELVPSAQKENRTTRLTDKFVRIETDRLDKLINLVGELVISRTQVVEMVKHTDDSDQKGVIAQLDRVTTELQHAAMNLRMVPIKQVFDRFPRMVRDLARSSEKEISLEIYGEQTELDRSLVNQIGDPLVHIIRNSIDHGIEAGPERLAQGKPEAGTIRLGARHEGSHILIEIEDDGQGLNLDRIRNKAVERNLISSDKTEITMDEAIDLLFRPGFSTADAVTDISGRGVGMDAVKAVIESLSGNIDVDSIPGQRTRVIIKLPLTLAIIKGLLVVADGETLAIPIQAVRESIQVQQEQIKTVRQNQVILLRDEIIPLYDLAECLGFHKYEPDGPLSVIVLEIRGQKNAFIVEDLIGQQEIVIKGLSDIIGDIPGIAGATVLGNGQVALILDNSTLLDRR